MKDEWRKTERHTQTYTEAGGMTHSIKDGEQIEWQNPTYCGRSLVIPNHHRTGPEISMKKCHVLVDGGRQIGKWESIVSSQRRVGQCDLLRI